MEEQNHVDAVLYVATELQMKELRQECTSEKEKDKSDMLSELYSDDKQREGYDAFALSEHNGQGKMRKVWRLTKNQNKKISNIYVICANLMLQEKGINSSRI